MRGGEGAGATPNAPRPPHTRRRCRCLCVCRGWRAAGTGLPELWESVEACWNSKLKCTDSLLRWIAAWCVPKRRPLRRLELDLLNIAVPPDAAAGLVAVLRRSKASLKDFDLVYGDRLWEQLMADGRARERAFLAAIAALRQLTRLDIQNQGANSKSLPVNTVLPTSLQKLFYYCGPLPQQAS